MAEWAPHLTGQRRHISVGAARIVLRNSAERRVNTARTPGLVRHRPALPANPITATFLNLAFDRPRKWRNSDLRGGEGSRGRRRGQRRDGVFIPLMAPRRTLSGRGGSDRCARGDAAARYGHSGLTDWPPRIHLNTSVTWRTSWWPDRSSAPPDRKAAAYHLWSKQLLHFVSQYCFLLS